MAALVPVAASSFPAAYSFLIREHAFESVRLEHALALIGRHGAQVADGTLHHLLALRCQLLPLRRELPGPRLLLRC